MTIPITCPHCHETIEVRLAVLKEGTKLPEAKALGLLDLGATPKEVAEAFGVTRQAIYDLKQRRKRRDAVTA